MSVSPTDVQLQPFFLPSVKGDLFSISFFSRATPAASQGILFFPAFAEEMNKSRRIVAEQSRAFAALGYSVLVVDWFGTGDSAGEFSEADWDTWLADAQHAIRWLQDNGVESIYFWGMRLGALLALDCARHCSAELKGILLWQPVHKGAVFLTQFLRLRLAADLVSADEKITTRELRAQLDEGQDVEVAGYALSPGLASAIDQLDLKELLAAYHGKLLWIEMLASEERPVPVATTRLIEEIQAGGGDIAFRKIVCEPFWSLQELVSAPALIESGTHAFQKTLPCAT